MVPAAGGGGARGSAPRCEWCSSRAEQTTRTDVRHTLSSIRRLEPDDNGSGLLFLRRAGPPFSGDAHVLARAGVAGGVYAEDGGGHPAGGAGKDWRDRDGRALRFDHVGRHFDLLSPRWPLWSVRYTPTGRSSTWRSVQRDPRRRPTGGSGLDRAGRGVRARRRSPSSTGGGKAGAGGQGNWPRPGRSRGPVPPRWGSAKARRVLELPSTQSRRELLWLLARP